MSCPMLIVYRKSREEMATTFMQCVTACLGHVVRNGCPVIEKYFADGELDFTVTGLHALTEERVLYIADWSTPAQRYADICCLTAIAEMQPSFLTILVPFFATGTMEREEVEGSIATANVDAKQISSLPCPKKLITIDLHTMQNQFYYHNTCVALESCMPYVSNMKLFSGNDTVVVFPDEGALKRFKKYFSEFTVARCTKIRSGEDRVVTLAADDAEKVSGKRVLIVDDLVRTGGTLLGCAKAVRAAGATEVAIFVTHAVFPNDEYKKFLADDSVQLFLTTNSVADSAKKMLAANTDDRSLFKVIPLANIAWEFVNQ